MVWAADAGRRVEHLARFRARQGDVLLQRARWHRRIHDQHDGIARQQRYRSKILQRIIADGLANMRSEHKRRFGRDQQRVAIRIGFRHDAGADPGGRASAVLDDDRLAQPILQMRRQQPRHDVGSTTRRERHDDADRTGWIGSLPCHKCRSQHHTRAARGQTANNRAPRPHSAVLARIALTCWMNCSACCAQRSGSTAAM